MSPRARGMHLHMLTRSHSENIHTGNIYDTEKLKVLLECVNDKMKFYIAMEIEMCGYCKILFI